MLFLFVKFGSFSGRFGFQFSFCSQYGLLCFFMKIFIRLRENLKKTVFNKIPEKI